MSTISFVTGGTGFIGSRLVRRLIAEGHTVRVLARSAEKARALFDDEAEIIPGDLDDAGALARGCRGADRVFHLAAQVGDFGPKKGYYHTNVEGTRARSTRPRGRPRGVSSISPPTRLPASSAHTSPTNRPPMRQTAGTTGYPRGWPSASSGTGTHKTGFPA